MVTKIKNPNTISEAVEEWLNEQKPTMALAVAIRKADRNSQPGDKKVFSVIALETYLHENDSDPLDLDTAKRWFTDEEYEQLLGNTPAKPVK